MKNIFYKSCLVVASVSWLASCKPEKDLVAPEVTAGSLDLTTYVAVGNSLTSGFSDGGLYYEGQKSSYVNVLADQFKLVNPSLVFNTPLVDAASPGAGGPSFSVSGSGLSTLIKIKVAAPLSLQTLSNCKGVSGLSPAPRAANGDGKILFGSSYNNETGLELTVTDIINGSSKLNTAPSIYTPQTPFHNIGVPGARAVDVNRVGYGGPKLLTLVTLIPINVKNANPFYSRFAKDQTTSSMLSDALALNPTFFSLFIGNNDVLLWASAGGPAPNPLLPTTITPVQEFSDSIEVVVNKLTANGAKGIVVNIAEITGTPYFTFMQPDTSLYMVDETSTTRKVRTDDLILLTLPQDSVLCHGMGATIGYPIPKTYTLTKNQQNQVSTAIAGYNAKLKAKADEKGLAFFDMDAFTKANQNGLKYNGIDMSGVFVTGGIFSLDGLHLTPRGYAALANEMLKTINAKYGSTFPGVDLGKKNAVIFPE